MFTTSDWYALPRSDQAGRRSELMHKHLGDVMQHNGVLQLEQLC